MESPFKTGDHITVGNYTIDVDLEKDGLAGRAIHLEDMIIWQKVDSTCQI